MDGTSGQLSLRVGGNRLWNWSSFDLKCHFDNWIARFSVMGFRTSRCIDRVEVQVQTKYKADR